MKTLAYEAVWSPLADLDRVELISVHPVDATTTDEEARRAATVAARDHRGNGPQVRTQVLRVRGK